jgi:hypothetical protein
MGRISPPATTRDDPATTPRRDAGRSPCVGPPRRPATSTPPKGALGDAGVRRGGGVEKTIFTMIKKTKIDVAG